jgi:predicted nucleic acid-binding protein
MSVFVETLAVAQRRLGLAAAEALHSVYAPLLEVAWIDEAAHRAAAMALFAARRRRVSLVDHASFGLMRERGLVRALSLDSHFTEQGLALLPPPAAPPSIGEGR